MEIKWICFTIIFIGILIYGIINRYFEYKEKNERRENNEH